MKLAVRFRVTRYAEQVDGNDRTTASLILHPLREEDPHSAARALWPNHPVAELTLSHVDPQMVAHMRDPGTVVVLTLEEQANLR